MSHKTSHNLGSVSVKLRYLPKTETVGDPKSSEEWGVPSHNIDGIAQQREDKEREREVGERERAQA